MQHEPPSIISVAAQDSEAVSALEGAINRGLRAYNQEQGLTHQHRYICLAVHDADGAVIAGLSGETDFGWLHICNLWVGSDIRKSGLGTRLVEQAHQIARGHGCTRAYLCTFDFQAEAFYEKLGYTPFGTLDDFPPGHRRIYFMRRL